MALAAAIAFGLGGQGVAQEMVQNAYEKGDETRQKIQQRQQSDSSSAGSAEGDDMPAFRRQ